MWQFDIISLYLVFANSSYAIITAYDDYIKKEVCDLVKLVATSVNEAPTNIYVACRNDILAEYVYHWNFID